jgi:type IV fimbrial biogenesis protein FimT
MDLERHVLDPAQGRLVLRRVAQPGFTLIELLVSISIFAILLMLAIPSYTRWMADAQTLNAAETVAAGLRTAYAEAVKRSTLVEFNIDPTTGGGGWIVQLVDGTLIKQDKFATGADHATFTVAPATSRTITFNHLGLVEQANAANPTVPLTSIDVSHPAATRQLRVLAPQFAGGAAGIRICDKAFAYPADPQGCP